MEGKTIGNYLIKRKLGEGGMGSVYLSRDLTLERDVAVKIISPQLTRNSDLMARFRVEAIAQARLNHSNIVTIHSFDHQDNAYYIVMEYIEGKTLKTLMAETGIIPVDQALRIVSHILDGLSYAHSKGVFHRDIKPANIFLSTDGEARIGDFGIAKVDGIDGLTRVGVRLGTPLYSSPEQILGKKIDAATDIYSLGVTLYEMVTGSAPFTSSKGSNYEIQQAHLDKIPLKPSQLNNTLLPEVDALIMKTLEKSPDQRFSNTSAFKMEVDKLAGISSGEASGNKKPRIRLLQLPDIKIPKLSPKFSLPGFKRKSSLKDSDISRRISSIIQSIKTMDRRKQLILILIPLTILLFVVIAFSETPEQINNRDALIKNTEKTSILKKTKRLNGPVSTYDRPLNSKHTNRRNQ